MNNDKENRDPHSVAYSAEWIIYPHLVRDNGVSIARQFFDGNRYDYYKRMKKQKRRKP